MERINKPKGTYADYVNGDYQDKQFVFELVKRNGANAVMASKETGKVVPFPMSYPLPLVGTVFFKDPVSKRTYPRRIRYVIGENEIYEDLQVAKDKALNEKPRPVVANFIKGRFYVDGNDSTLLKYMFTSDVCETKEGRDGKKEIIYRLVDKSTQNNKFKEQFKLEFDTVNWCQTADLKTKILPLAKLILNEEQLLQSSSDIRFDLTVMAKRNPGAFKTMLDDPKTERGIILNAAVELGIIGVNTHMNALYWTHDMQSPFSVAEVGHNPLKDFIAKSFTTQREGVYYQIKKAVESYGDNVPPSRVVDPAPVPNDEINVILELAIQKGVVAVSSNNVWFKFRDKNYQKQDSILKALIENPSLVEEMRSDILSMTS